VSGSSPLVRRSRSERNLKKLLLVMSMRLKEISLVEDLVAVDPVEEVVAVVEEVVAVVVEAVAVVVEAVAVAVEEEVAVEEDFN
jgi:hypothetical protein